MLSEGKVIAMVAVSDIKVGKDFYGVKLGLTQKNENPGGVAYECGGGELFVYQSTTAGSGRATSASWNVSDIGAVVSDLSSKGITFEHYEIPGAVWEDDVAVMGNMRAAWFKDPDGNILGINSGS